MGEHVIYIHISGGSTKWDTTDAGFNVLMSEMGVDFKAVSPPAHCEQKTVPCDPDSSVLSEASPSLLEDTNNIGLMPEGAGPVPGGGSTKRAPERGTGFSPEPKRINRRPSGSLGGIIKVSQPV